MKIVDADKLEGNKDNIKKEVSARGFVLVSPMADFLCKSVGAIKLGNLRRISFEFAFFLAIL